MGRRADEETIVQILAQMQVLSRSSLRLLRSSPNVATPPAPVRRLSALPLRALSRRGFPLMAAPNPPVRHVSRKIGQNLSVDPILIRKQSGKIVYTRFCDRWPHGYRNMASGVGVKGEELGKPDGRLIIPCANDDTSSLGEHTHKKLIACDVDDCPAHGDENDDAFRATAEVIDGNQDRIPTDSEDETMFRIAQEDFDIDRVYPMYPLSKSRHRDVVEEIMDISESDSEDETMFRIAQEDFDIDRVNLMYPFSKSRHRDGSIYRVRRSWKTEYHVADRTETRLEAMKLSEPPNCCLHADGTCKSHPPGSMLQFLSLKLAKLYMDGGSVALYGYIAVRDDLDPLLNYVINFGRDDPIIVEQGSVINMVGPKRGIELVDSTLIEYDMRIKTGKHEKDDLQLIDGVTLIDSYYAADCCVFKGRIRGERGAIDIMASHIDYAVEATIKVLILDVHSSFNLCLSCCTSGLHEEIQLFDGFIGRSRGLKRFVVAVRMGTPVELKFKVGSGSSISVDHCCSFMAKQHGCVGQEIKTDLALYSVKVTWSPLPVDRGGL